MKDETNKASASPSILPPSTFLLSLRPIVADDREFLCRVYSSTRQEELALVDWSEAQKDAFLTSQFNAQHQYYQENYKDTAFQVIQCDGVLAGRLYVARWEKEIRIVDIAFLAEFRQRGLGTQLMQDLFAEADRAAKPVRIHVEKFNRALRLYWRLGFVPVEDRGVYLLMERQPKTADAPITTTQ
jgi:ribosomal protein S18 acetylase RimI-like enzyme